MSHLPKGIWQGGTRIIRWALGRRHAFERGALGFTPLRLMYARSASRLSRVDPSAIARHHRHLRNNHFLVAYGGFVLLAEFLADLADEAFDALR